MFNLHCTIFGINYSKNLTLQFFFGNEEQNYTLCTESCCQVGRQSTRAQTIEQTRRTKPNPLHWNWISAVAQVSRTIPASHASLVCQNATSGSRRARLVFSTEILIICREAWKNHHRVPAIIHSRHNSIMEFFRVVNVLYFYCDYYCVLTDFASKT